ncbi:FAD-dependent oxidoreductase [Mesorhizobium sp. INR15]|uniref:FAD-dependent oxidoreductase n=1 Tax=Mesorhizobium sp. INR15 TaxID=2654248 RepID=UPI001896421C|nr:FAD-dependent oxidoreductase [Mesorhizobium sp. INR15]
MIAAGAGPKLPDIPGLLEAGFLSNETVFSLTEPPKKLLVIGGGPLGCEMAQAFCRLGVHVVIAQKEPTFLPGEEREAAQLLSGSMVRDGVEVRLNSTVVAVRTENNMKLGY